MPLRVNGTAVNANIKTLGAYSFVCGEAALLLQAVYRALPAMRFGNGSSLNWNFPDVHPVYIMQVYTLNIVFYLRSFASICG